VWSWLFWGNWVSCISVSWSALSQWWKARSWMILQDENRMVSAWWYSFKLTNRGKSSIMVKCDVWWPRIWFNNFLVHHFSHYLPPLSWHQLVRYRLVKHIFWNSHLSPVSLAKCVWYEHCQYILIRPVTPVCRPLYLHCKELLM